MRHASAPATRPHVAGAAQSRWRRPRPAGVRPLLSIRRCGWTVAAAGPSAGGTSSPPRATLVLLPPLGGCSHCPGAALTTHPPRPPRSPRPPHRPSSAAPHRAALPHLGDRRPAHAAAERRFLPPNRAVSPSHPPLSFCCRLVVPAFRPSLTCFPLPPTPCPPPPVPPILVSLHSFAPCHLPSSLSVTPSLT